MQGAAANLNHLLGVAVLTVSVVATAELARAGRVLNVPLGIAIGVLPWLVGDAPPEAQIITTIAAAVIIAASVPRGSVRESYGTADPVIR